MPGADVTEPVHNALVEQDMVGIDQFADGRCQGFGYGMRHCGHFLLSYRAWMNSKVPNYLKGAPSDEQIAAFRRDR
jgi:hypothetical protein